MKQFATQGIVLSRTNYGEADRIIRFITPDHGKTTVIAKSVRKSNAKLAGAIELFSVSDITIVVGRTDINNLISARLVRHYGNIVKDSDRTNAGYEFLKILDKSTEDQPEKAYFDLLDKALAALHDEAVSTELTDLWFKMQLLKITGHTPNLKTDESGKKLSESKTFSFDYDKMKFVSSEKGDFNAKQIKFLRVGFAAESPGVLTRVEAAEKYLPATQPLVQILLESFLRV